MTARALPLALLLAVPAGAEPPAPPPPRFSFGGEVSFAHAPADPAFFNYTDYEYTALRITRLALSGSLRLHESLSLLGEVRSDNFEEPRVHALYARFTPWRDRGFDLQAGVIPPVFGAYPRRAYANDNYLIGHPLGYQYLTSLRPDAMPATEGDILRMRGRGWRPFFPIGSAEVAPGLPIANSLRWDTGIQARLGSEKVEALAGLTLGSLSNPRVEDDNDGKNLAGRVALRPLVGLVLGASASRGAYADEDALAGTGIAAGDLKQTAWGADAEYSRGYGLVRVEAVWTTWDAPEPIAGPLEANAVFVEGRYKLLPGLYAAARVDRLSFSRLAGGQRWDAPVTRFEGGGGYYFRRNLLLKAVYQYNRREGERTTTLSIVAGQVLFWF